MASLRNPLINERTKVRIKIKSQISYKFPLPPELPYIPHLPIPDPQEDLDSSFLYLTSKLQAFPLDPKVSVSPENIQLPILASFFFFFLKKTLERAFRV